MSLQTGTVGDMSDDTAFSAASILGPFADDLLEEIVASQQARVDRVDLAISALTTREAQLVREAAVMAYVLGWLKGNAGSNNVSFRANYPGDNAMLVEVLTECASKGALYPMVACAFRGLRPETYEEAKRLLDPEGIHG